MYEARSVEYIRIYKSIVIDFFLRLKIHIIRADVPRFDIENLNFIVKFKFKCLFFKPHLEEYKKITVNVISKTYNITHNNVYIIIQSITVFSLHTF